MELLGEYSEDVSPPQSGAKPALLRRDDIVVAPAVMSAVPSSTSALSLYVSNPTNRVSEALNSAVTKGVMTTNIPAEQLWAKVAGPCNPYAAKQLVNDKHTTIVGALQIENLELTSFEEQYRTYLAYGYAADPAGSGGIIGSAARFSAMGGQSVVTAPVVKGKPQAPNTNATNAVTLKRPRVAAGDPSDVDGYMGPWAGYDGLLEARITALESGTLSEFQKKLRAEQGYNPDKPGKIKDGDKLATGPSVNEAEEAAAPTSRDAPLVESEPDREARARREAAAALTLTAAASAGTVEGEPEPVPAVVAVTAGEGLTPDQCTSTFHGKEMFDYQGRSWIEAPKGVRPDGGDHECFIPKKLIHKYTGHTQGIHSIQFIPGTGHLLLSGSIDTRIKIWDVFNSRNVKRTYVGHSAAVRHVRFNNDGARFSSASYDKHVKVWDTETGKCVNTYTNERVPYTVTWYPVDNNVILVGSANRKIVQYDVRSGEVVLEYDHHLGAVNTITFVDDNRRIVTTSDDKKVLVWEYNIPNPIKYISDPAMHSIPAVALHPSSQHFVGQSMDNKLAVFQCGERVSLNRKKVFSGHITAGYACQPAFAPSGQFLCSGDGEGQCWFWDWKTTKVLKKFKAHERGPAICVQWHPLQPSWVATCGWDGMIKLWD